jgi:putative MATE family efflux protein
MLGKKTEPNLNLLHLAWPMLIEELTGGITGLTDTLFISMISDEAAASVGMLSPVLWLGYFILPQFTSAGTSVAAQYMGAGRKDKLLPAWAANIAISTLMGGLLALLLSAFHGRVGLWLGMSAGQNAYAAQYLSVIAFNFFVVGLRASYSSILASRTLTRWNMVASIVTNVVNIPLNWLLMKGFWIVPAMGVSGIALATVIAYALGFGVIFFMVHARLKVSFLVKGLWREMARVVGPIFRIGVPAALEPFSYTVQSLVVSVLIISLGTAAMGANTYVNKFIFLDMAVSWSFTMAGQIVMSHHLGAGRIEEVKRGFWRIALVIASFALAVFIVIAAFNRFFLSFFTSDPVILSLGLKGILVFLAMEPIRSVNILGGIALKTVGDGKFSVVVALAFMWGLVPLLILSCSLGFGIVGVWVCCLLDETIRAVINVWRWKSGRWIGKSVIAQDTSINDKKDLTNDQ